MAASLGQGCEPSWLPRKHRSVDEVDSQMLLELMMGPIDQRRRSSSSSSKDTTNTLDLLGALQPPNYESAIELDSGSPPPSGWEKCLDLKTGRIYFLNRSTGLSSSSDPRKASLQANMNWPPSPTTSELTVEATSEVKAASDQLDFNINDLKKKKKKKKEALVEAKSLDLSLSLHVGSSPKPMIYKEDLPFEGCPPSLSHNSLSKGLATRASSSSSTTSSPTHETASFNRDTINEGLRRPPKSQALHTKEGENKIISKDNHSTSRNHNLGGIRNNGLLAHDEERLRKPEGGEAAMNSMVTVGCANCLMFVMLSRSNPKCPRCGSCPLLDSPQPNAKK